MKLVYFAWIRDYVGMNEEDLDLPQNLLTIKDLLDWQKSRGEGFERAFADPDLVRVALDQFHAEPDDRIGATQEIAFFPPMTGG